MDRHPTYAQCLVPSLYQSAPIIHIDSSNRSTLSLLYTSIIASTPAASPIRSPPAASVGAARPPAVIDEAAAPAEVAAFDCVDPCPVGPVVVDVARVGDVVEVIVDVMPFAVRVVLVVIVPFVIVEVPVESDIAEVVELTADAVGAADAELAAVVEVVEVEEPVALDPAAGPSPFETGTAMM